MSNDHWFKRTVSKFSRAASIIIINAMRSLIEENGYVSVNVLYQYLNEEVPLGYENYGWYNLDDVHIVQHIPCLSILDPVDIIFPEPVNLTNVERKYKMIKIELCKGCIHEGICKYKNSYADLFNTAKNLNLTNVEESSTFSVSISCKYFKPINNDYANFGSR